MTLLDGGAAPTRRSAQLAVADCEHYVRGHHQWFTRVVGAIGRAYGLPPQVHEELLAELYGALFRSWHPELLHAHEHTRNGFAYRELARRAERRAERHRGARAGQRAWGVHSILLDVLDPDERDVIIMAYGIRKDAGQIAAELDLSDRQVSRLHDRAMAKLGAALPRDWAHRIWGAA